MVSLSSPRVPESITYYYEHTLHVPTKTHCKYSRRGADGDERAQAVQQRERSEVSTDNHDGAQEGQEVPAD